MSRVAALTYVTAKRIASRDDLNFDEKWVRTGLGDVILKTRSEPRRRRTPRPSVATRRCCHVDSRDD